MTARNAEPSLVIGTTSANFTFDQPGRAAPPPAAGGAAEDDIVRLRALLRPIISDLLREELRNTMRMRG